MRQYCSSAPAAVTSHSHVGSGRPDTPKLVWGVTKAAGLAFEATNSSRPPLDPMLQVGERVSGWYQAHKECRWLSRLHTTLMELDSM
jgi:hypothetical protein